MSLLEVHIRLANTVLYYFIILGVWGLGRSIQRKGVSPSYWGALALAELLILVQDGLGAYLWLGSLRPARAHHLLYGILSTLVIPAAYAYTRGREERREMLVYSITILVTIGLILRAITTGG